MRIAAEIVLMLLIIAVLISASVIGIYAHSTLDREYNLSGQLDRLQLLRAMAISLLIVPLAYYFGSNIRYLLYDRKHEEIMKALEEGTRELRFRNSYLNNYSKGRS